MKAAIRCAALTGILLIDGAALHAQDVQPRVYTPAPVGLHVVTLGYAYSTGAVLFDKTIPIENASADIHSFNLAISRSISVFGRAGRADVVIPWVTGTWQGDLDQPGSTTARTGFGDPVARLVVALIGAPALTSDQFARFQPKTIVGATLRVGIPLGQYDADRLVNLGSHRWRFGPQVGVSHIAGRLLAEAYAGAWFFTDNGAFLGTSTLSQDPLWTIQLHVGYRFRRGFWLAVSSRQSLGGATTVDDGDKLTPESNNRLGFTLAVPFSRRYALRAVLTTGLKATVGNDYTTVGLSWQVLLN